MKDISPKAEPVAWSVIVGLIIAALASYGLNITVELKAALVVIVPMGIAAIIARQNVSPLPTVQKQIDHAALTGDAPQVT